MDFKIPGFENVGQIYRNVSTPALYEQIVQRREGVLAHLGPVVVRTGQHTGRAPNDKFIVGEETSQDEIWWGNVNKPFDSQKFERLYARQLAYLQDKDLFVEDCYAGADPKYRVAIRVITETAWHNLFARNMLIREPDAAKLADFEPQFTVVNSPRFQASRELDGTNSEAFIILKTWKEGIAAWRQRLWCCCVTGKASGTARTALLVGRTWV